MVVADGCLATGTVDHACGAVYLYLATAYDVGIEGLGAATVDASRAIDGGVEVLYAKFFAIDVSATIGVVYGLVARAGELDIAATRYGGCKLAVVEVLDFDVATGAYDGACEVGGCYYYLDVRYVAVLFASYNERLAHEGDVNIGYLGGVAIYAYLLLVALGKLDVEWGVGDDGLKLS